jgi:hypothetical protein
MTIRYSVTADFKSLGEWVKIIGGKHVPYVTSKTLTDLAGEVNSAAIQELGKYFTLRNKYVIRSFRKTMADKRQWPFCYSQAGSIAPFFDLQVSGGMKTGKSGAWLGVPKARGEPLGARPNVSNIISKPLWVSQLLQKKGYLIVPGAVSKSPLLLKQTRVASRRNKKRPHTARRKRTHHTGKRGWKRETIYVMKKDVKIPARFPFDEIAKRTIEQRYEEIFRRNLNEAIN